MGDDQPLGAAIGWITAVMLGSVGTAIAVIAVAGLGYAMLQGHLSYRDSIRVIFGCVILFGAPAIAHGLMDMAESSPAPIVLEAPVAHPPIAVTLQPRSPPGSTPGYDPYAGASVPQ